jgi:hypothetical protein
MCASCCRYVGILVEELVGLNKAGVALLMAVCLWTIRSTAGLPVEQVGFFLGGGWELRVGCSPSRMTCHARSQ